MPKLSFQYVRQGQTESLLTFLERRFRYHDAGEWKKLISKGFVKVNGGKAKPGQILESRHKIVYEPPPVPEPEIDRSYTIIYEDQHILAVTKSGNIPTSPSGKYWFNCLTHVLQDALGLDWLHAVHRLDRETSGVNLFAKSKEAARVLGKSFQQGQVRKSYTAVVWGQMPFKEIFVSAPLRGAHEGSIHIKQAVHSGGRSSQTHFKLEALMEGASLMTAVPLTGRTHQIRAHASMLGHPVVGDKLYGATESSFLEWMKFGDRGSADRQLLHATSLEFPHPLTNKTMLVKSPPDALMRLYVDRYAISPASNEIVKT